MAVIEPVNTQQVLQMGSHSEKLQQTIQQQTTILSQQLKEEQIKLSELQSTEVQDPENVNPGEPTNPEGRGRKGRLRSRSRIYSVSANEDTTEQALGPLERLGGERVNIVA